VTFRKDEDGEKALDALNGSVLDGRSVSQRVTPVLQYLFCSLRLCFYT